MTTDLRMKTASARFRSGKSDGHADRNRQRLGHDSSPAGDHAGLSVHRHSQRAAAGFEAAVTRRPATRLSTASRSTATPRPTIPSCCWPADKAAFRCKQRARNFPAALLEVCQSLADTNRERRGRREARDPALHRSRRRIARKPCASRKPSPIRCWSKPPGQAPTPTGDACWRRWGHAAYPSTPIKSKFPSAIKLSSAKAR